MLNIYVCWLQVWCIKWKNVYLRRVFHGIRFILRLVKIACRDDKQFFLRFTGKSR